MKGRGGMGMKKHGQSGRAGKSPKFRHAMKREAEADERKPRKSRQPMFSSVKKALDGFSFWRTIYGKLDG